VTVGSAVPLAAFLAAFAAACIALELLGVILFCSPGAFLLAAALPWFWWMHVAGFSGLRGFRALLSLLVRLSLAALFIALMADPRAIRRNDVLSVVYALDVSDSIGQSARDAALRYVAATASQKPQKDEAGLVVFGSDAAVELPPRTSFPLEALNCRIARDGTDLAKGLSLAAAMVPDDHPGRIVLISDGNQTEGNLSETLAELKSRDVPVDVLPIAYDYAHEVWLEKLELPQFVRTGETYEASVVLSSLQAGSGRLTLRENGRAIYEGSVDFDAGKNRYVMPIYLREPGYYEYVASIDLPAGMDGWQENNKAVGWLYLRGEGKVMVVTDPAGDPRDWQTLAEALRRGKFAVEERDAYEFPRDTLSLMPYDCVIFVNVPADAFDAMQLEALRAAVYGQGTGFLMVGGQNSFGPGGYHRTAVETALPVTMDISEKKILPKGALVIVLHTCEFPEGNTWGKRVAKEAIKVLGAQDEVGVLVYDYSGQQKWLFDLTPAGRYDELAVLINQAQIGDMPSFSTTMSMGLDALKASDAATKHMIIISDGDPSPPPPELVQGFVQEKVSVSTVAVFPHGEQDVSVLSHIAAATGGRFYYPQDPEQLPSIFIKEAKTLKRSMIQNVTFVPQAEAPSAIMKGLTAVPQLRGYVLTTPKDRALTVLKAPETEQVDPVLATWHYGVGKTAAFTSDLSPNWAAAWVSWEGYLSFVQQLVTDIARTEQEGHLRTRAFADGSTGVILVEDFHPRDAFLDMEATVTGPRGRSESVRLEQLGPRRYQARFPLWGEGRYQIVGAAAGDGRQERLVSGFAVPYSAEYLRFRSSPITLSEVADRTGGRMLGGAETGGDVFVKERKPKATSRPLTDLLLVLLACLIPLDVGVRRVQLDWALIRGWLSLGRARVPSGETFEALLRRKKDIALPRAEEKGRRPVPGVSPPAGRAEATAEGAVEPARPEAAEKEAGAGQPSTTERLLARKKRWKKDKS
jgi:uncharacterized membrane protein